MGAWDITDKSVHTELQTPNVSLRGISLAIGLPPAEGPSPTGTSRLHSTSATACKSLTLCVTLLPLAHGYDFSHACNWERDLA